MNWKKIGAGAAAVWMGVVVVNEARLAAARRRSSVQDVAQSTRTAPDEARGDASGAQVDPGVPSDRFRNNPGPSERKANPLTVGNENVGVGQWDWTKGRFNR